MITDNMPWGVGLGSTFYQKMNTPGVSLWNAYLPFCCHYQQVYHSWNIYCVMATLIHISNQDILGWGKGREDLLWVWPVYWLRQKKEASVISSLWYPHSVQTDTHLHIHLLTHKSLLTFHRVVWLGGNLYHWGTIRRLSNVVFCPMIHLCERKCHLDSELHQQASSLGPPRGKGFIQTHGWPVWLQFDWCTYIWGQTFSMGWVDVKQG